MMHGQKNIKYNVLDGKIISLNISVKTLHKLQRMMVIRK